VPTIAVPQPPAPDATVAAPVEPAVAPPDPAAVAPGAPPAAVQPPTAPRAQGDVPYVYELPLPTRQALPKMQVSMHVWNADPTRRFVILDGVRAGEGEAAGDNLTVLEIRREGVVLDFRGSRFLLPNGGY
jgi:general secretion pathway protein B